jgi:hypothetical protein
VIALEHIRGMGYAYATLRTATPLSTRDIMRTLVAGDPTRGLAGRYDEEHETQLRDTLLARIEAGLIQSPVGLFFESLVIEGKIVPEALSPRMADLWTDTITAELERLGIPRAEVIGATDR